MVEFDHPHTLLQNSSGAFSNYVSKLGATEVERLTKVARDCYQRLQDEKNATGEAGILQNNAESDKTGNEDELIEVRNKLK